MSNLVKLSSSLLNSLEYPASRICFSPFVFILFSHLRNVCASKSDTNLVFSPSALNHVLCSGVDNIRSLLKSHLGFPTKHTHTCRNGHSHPFSDLIQCSQEWKRHSFWTQLAGRPHMCVCLCVCVYKRTSPQNTETVTYIHIEEFLPSGEKQKKSLIMSCV